MPYNLWSGPPTSGNSTPLRENIPESPTDGFPDFAQLPTPDSISQPRRARAGTVPSRFSPGGAHLAALPSGLAAKSARVTPSQSPFGQSPSPAIESDNLNTNILNNNTSASSALLSRLRAGSMPQRPQFAPIPGTSSPFGPSIFSSWNPTGLGRERGSTLASIASVPSNGPSSPSQSQFSKEGGNESDAHMRTLDYLGLAETPQQSHATMASSYRQPNLNLVNQPNRIRSYSVNNKNVHADEYGDDDYGISTSNGHTVTSIQELQDQIAQHNLHVHQVQSILLNENYTSRRRAQTASALESPGARGINLYLNNTSSGLPNPLTSTQLPMQENNQYEELSQSINNMSLGNANTRNAGLLGVDDQGLEGPTSALWLGNIPTSTTGTTLIEMFKSHGLVLSARVLTHKNCGFVNFDSVESAISAKAAFNGKELFPGATPIRINFAKPVSSDNTPGHDGAFPSPSPVSFSQGQDGAQRNAGAIGEVAAPVNNGPPSAPALCEITTEVLDIVGQFEATPNEVVRVTLMMQSALTFTDLRDEIPSIKDVKENRIHDAPKLRDIRKKMDSSWGIDDIEGAARDMLPEIRELASDYLGNTIVQKLFEQCSDPVRDEMLDPIAPHLAEIGIHKNGTWAAQKIINMCKTDYQKETIVRGIRPYTVPLFLDQYGNYVLQGCLTFGVPFNDFLFETIMSCFPQLCEGRFSVRAMRATLESNCAKEHQKMVAALIAIHSVQLATNANGALMLTWYLDTCNFPNRRTVLAPRVIPYLVHLCTHKLAYPTVIKVINQKNEPEARDSVLKALFFTPNDQVLEAILSDSNTGATMVFKVLGVPYFDESMRAEAVENVKNVLVRMRAQPNQGYKRLMDEVGLSTRNSGVPSRDSSAQPDHRRPTSSRQPNLNVHQGHHGHQAQQSNRQQFYNPMQPAAPQSGYDAGYNDGAAGTFPPYNQPMMYNAPNGGAQQMQFPPQMLTRGPQPMPYGYPMQAGYAPQLNQYNQASMANGSPMGTPLVGTAHMAPMSGFTGPPGFGFGYAHQVGNMGGMQQNGNMGAPPMVNMNMNPGQQDQGNHYGGHGVRRGRVSYL